MLSGGRMPMASRWLGPMYGGVSAYSDAAALDGRLGGVRGAGERLVGPHAGRDHAARGETD